MRGEISQATTCIPRAARWIASMPVPQFNSRTRWPGWKTRSRSLHTESRRVWPIRVPLKLRSYWTAALSQYAWGDPARDGNDSLTGPILLYGEESAQSAARFGLGCKKFVNS